MRITTRTGQYQNEDGIYTIIEKHDDDQLISAIYADPTTGQIMNIETAEGYRGEGHATSLIEYAIDNGIELLHSPIWSCTDEGAAFAEATSHLIDTIDDEDAYGWDDYASTIAC